MPRHVHRRVEYLEHALLLRATPPCCATGEVRLEETLVTDVGEVAARPVSHGFIRPVPKIMHRRRR
eukprot:219966-Pyramimonas_sp.AAC.1